jgi:CheY-like chemotaxis protein
MKILVIDDDPMRANNFVNLGHDVKIAHGFDQISFWLDHGPYDLICLDHDMPMMNGLSVIKAFGGSLCWYPVCLWSQNAEKRTEMLKVLEEKFDEETSNASDTLPKFYESAFSTHSWYIDSILEWASRPPKKVQGVK